MTYHLQVEGMTCAHCENSVMAGLMALQGVRSVEVRRDSGRVQVEGNASADLLVSTIEGLGFSARLAPSSD